MFKMLRFFNVRAIFGLSFIFLLGVSNALGQEETEKIDSALFAQLDQTLSSSNTELDIEVDFSYGSNGVDGGFSIISNSPYLIPTLVAFFKEKSDTLFEIGIHTDCKGKSSYNAKVSEIQAKYLYKELLLNGVGDNIRIVGYGESKPKTNCKCRNCSDKEHNEDNRISVTYVSDI